MILNKIDYLIVRTKTPDYPQLVRWDKSGVLIFNGMIEINIDLKFKEDPYSTLELIDDFLDKVEWSKYRIQLIEIKNYLYEIWEDTDLRISSKEPHFVRE